MEKTFKDVLKKRNQAYKEYLEALKQANKLKRTVIALENECISLKGWGDKFERKIPISINFSGYED